MSPEVIFAALVTTIRDVKEAPLSSFYLPFMGRIPLDQFNSIMRLIEKMGFCSIRSNYVRFVPPAPDSACATLLSKLDAILSAHS